MVRSYYWRCLLYLGAAVLVVLSSLAFHRRQSHALIDRTGYQVSGSFGSYGVPPATRWLHQEDQQFYVGSRAKEGYTRGTFASQVFVAPARLDFLVSGFPSADGNQLNLQTIYRSGQLRLGVVDEPGGEWRHYYWKVPKDWRGQEVALIARSEATGADSWFGLSLPRGGTASDENAASLSRTVFIFCSILSEGMLFLLPGIAAAWLIDRRHNLDPLRFVCLTFVASAAAGYLAFWVYLYSAKAGKELSKALVAVSLTAFLYAALTRRLNFKLLREVAICAFLMAITTTLCTAVGFLYEHSEDAGMQAEDRFADPLPIDNIIPYVFADKLYRSVPVRPFLMEGWQSSDRPPLQTGITLLQFPIWDNATRELRYQILGTFLQSMWIAAAWILLRLIGASKRTIVVVLALCLFSQFFVVNTFFVWPKLLCAAFFILGLCALRFVPGTIERAGPFDVALAGAAISLALLSHGGAAFSVIALAFVLLITRQLPSLRSMVAGFAMMLVFMVPWIGYQKLYNPPGNRLLKMHLAGDPTLDPMSFGEALKDAYTKPGISQILKNKIENGKILFGQRLPWESLRQPVAAGAPRWRPLLDWYKAGAFFYVFQSPGLLDIGLLVLLVARIRAVKSGVSPVLTQIGRLFLLFFASMLVWCLLMYGPGATQIHQGSFADMVLLFVVLATSIAVVTPRLANAVLFLQVLVVFPMVSLSEASLRPAGDVVWSGGLDPVMAGLLGLTLVTAAFIGWKAGFSRSGMHPWEAWSTTP